MVSLLSGSRHFSFAFCFAAVVLGSLSAKAANSYRLNAGNNVRILEHSICRTVTNSTSKDYFIPTKTSGEWTAFLANLPASVTAVNCCPAGFVLVPPVASKSMNEFCVMKWEARVSAGTAVATSVGSPQSGITKAAAMTACTNLGTGYAMLTNDQWTAIMRDVESVGANWSGGSRKSGGIFVGNLGYTSAVSYTGGYQEAGEANVKARFTLSNGSQVWHMNGNVSEWVQGTVVTSDVARDATNFALGSRASGGFAKMLAADRTKWGPENDDYGSGCGDPTPQSNCGVGYYMATNGYANITRGGESTDNRWDAFTMESWATGVALSWVGFRCGYIPF